MQKNEFISAVSDITGMTKKDTRECIDACARVIIESIKNDEEVNLVGMGKFSPMIRGDSPRINPRTQERVISPKHRVMKFTPSSNVKREVYDI